MNSFSLPASRNSLLRRASRTSPAAALPAVPRVAHRTVMAVLPGRCTLSSAMAADVRLRFLSSPAEIVPCTAAIASKHSVRTVSDRMKEKRNCFRAVPFFYDLQILSTSTCNLSRRIFVSFSFSARVKRYAFSFGSVPDGRMTIRSSSLSPKESTLLLGRPV